MNERIQIAPPTPEQTKALINTIVDNMAGSDHLSAMEREFFVRKTFEYLCPDQKYPDDKKAVDQ